MLRMQALVMLPPRCEPGLVEGLGIGLRAAEFARDLDAARRLDRRCEARQALAMARLGGDLRGAISCAAAAAIPMPAARTTPIREVRETRGTATSAIWNVT